MIVEVMKFGFMFVTVENCWISDSIKPKCLIYMCVWGIWWSLEVLKVARPQARPTKVARVVEQQIRSFCLLSDLPLDQLLDPLEPLDPVERNVRDILFYIQGFISWFFRSQSQYIGIVYSCIAITF